MGKSRWNREPMLPEACVSDVLEELHGSRFRSHSVVNRTLARVRESYHWVNCRSDVQEWIKRCYLCASKEVPKTRSKRKLQQYISGIPYERIVIQDFFQKITSSEKKLFGLLMYYLSKWNEVVHIPNHEVLHFVSGPYQRMSCPSSANIYKT